ncbi:MAG: FtsX-like permease family protein [Candidatus Limnocylindrales bacterium]
MGVVSVSLRRLPAERAAAAGFAALLFLTALCFATAPRVAEHVADTALHQELAAAPSVERNVTIIETASGFRGRQDNPAAPALDTVDQVRAAGLGLQSAFPPVIAALVQDRRFVVDSSIWDVTAGAGNSSQLALRIQEGVEDHLRLVKGRWPTGKVTIIPDPRAGAPPGSLSAVYEGVLPATSATEMGVGVGSTLTLDLSSTDPLNAGVGGAAQLVIVGTYEVADPADPFWLDDSTVATFRRVGSDLEIVLSTALLSVDAYGSFKTNTRGFGLPLRYQWRFYLDTPHFDANTLDDAVTAMRRLESAPPRTGISAVLADTTLRSGLLRLLVAHQQSWRSVDAILAVVWLGTAVLATATLAVVAVLASGGRRRVAWLFRARGASRLQLIAATGVEGLLLSVPAVALALGLAVLLEPAATMLPSVLPTVAVAALATIALVAVVAGGQAVANPAGQAARIARRTSARRIVAETVLVVVAIAGALLLRQRSLSGTGSSGQLQGADPVIALVPALVGIAAGVVAMRVYPWPTRLLGALAAVRRDLVPVLAIRRAIRGRSAAPVLLILVATATIGAFASATVAHLEDAAELASWQQVGAAYRLDAVTGRLPADFEPAKLPGVEAAALASWQPVVTSRGRIGLLLLDAVPFEAVVGGTPADPGLPADMLAEPPRGTATTPPSSPLAAPLPGVVSAVLGLRPGDVFKATIHGYDRPVRVVAVRTSFPGVAAGDMFVVLSRPEMAALDPDAARLPTIAYLRAPASAAAGLREAVGGLSADVSLLSQAEVVAGIRASPTIGAVRTGVTAAAIAAIAFAALAVAAALAIAGAAQRAELAHLRIFGLTRRQAAWSIFLEYGPSSVVAFALGVGLGLGLFVFLLPGLGLAAVIGSPVDVPVTVDAFHLALLLGAMLVMVIGGWVIGVLAQRDTDPATAVRGGIA